MYTYRLRAGETAVTSQTREFCVDEHEWDEILLISSRSKYGVKDRCLSVWIYGTMILNFSSVRYVFFFFFEEEEEEKEEIIWNYSSKI